MRALLFCTMTLLCSCGGEATPPSDAGASDDAPDLAAPVTAPMQVREHLLQGLREQNQQANEREAAFEQTLHGSER